MIQSTFRPRGELAATVELGAAFRCDATLGTRESPRVVVALFDLRDWQGWFEQARFLLDAREAARVARAHAEADRRALVFAYAFHRLVLGGLLGMSPASVPLARDGNGKPVLEGLALETSLSHSTPYVAVAACATGTVGVDLEPALRSVVMPEIAAQVCHPREARQLAAVAPRARARALLALWVGKEALLKAAGIGLAREMSSFVAVPSPESGTRVQMLEAGEDCIAAVAGPTGVPVDCAWIRPCAVEASACAA